MVEHFHQQGQTEAKGNQGCRPLGLNGASQVGQRHGAVQQGPRSHAEHCHAAHHPGQVAQAGADAHSREQDGPPGWVFRRGLFAFFLLDSDKLQPLPERKAVLIGDALHDKQNKQAHQQAGTGIAQGAVPHKQGHHAAGHQQQGAFAQQLAAVHRDITAQQAKRQYQPQLGDSARQSRTNGQRSNGHTCRQKRQHQLRQRRTHRHQRAAHHPHRQPAQRPAPRCAARSQPAADTSQQQAQSIEQQCREKKHSFLVRSLGGVASSTPRTGMKITGHLPFIAR